MRPWTTLGLLFIAAVAIDVSVSLLRPHRFLSVGLNGSVGELGMIASLLAIPAVIIFLPTRVAATVRGPARAVLAVFVSWFMLVQSWFAFAAPASKELALQRGDIDYDDVGMNVSLIMMGWFPALLVTLFCAAIRKGRVHPNDVRSEDPI